MHLYIGIFSVAVAYWAGSGNFGDAPERYAERHWQEYTAAAETILSDLKR